jgi:hypothetical protein
MTEIFTVSKLQNIMQDLSFWRQWLWWVRTFRLWRNVVRREPDVSELTYILHSPVHKVSQASNQQKQAENSPPFFLVLVLDPEVGINIFIWSEGFSPNYTALQKERTLLYTAFNPGEHSLNLSWRKGSIHVSRKLRIEASVASSWVAILVPFQLFLPYQSVRTGTNKAAKLDTNTWLGVNGNDHTATKIQDGQSKGSRNSAAAR